MIDYCFCIHTMKYSPSWSAQLSPKKVYEASEVLRLTKAPRAIQLPGLTSVAKSRGYALKFCVPYVLRERIDNLGCSLVLYLEISPTVRKSRLPKKWAKQKNHQIYFISHRIALPICSMNNHDFYCASELSPRLRIAKLMKLAQGAHFRSLKST
jgi:hypothetical protein